MKPVASGFVVYSGRRYFWARVRKVHGRVWSEAKFDSHQLYTKERAFLVPGAYFSILKGGTIRFSRLRWRKRELDLARRNAKRLLDLFRNDPDDHDPA